MGVPAFFMWVQRKYPEVLKQAIYQDPAKAQPGDINPDTGLPRNPNGVEFDNLYLDMNGLVHPCCHPEHGPQPETEDDMFKAILAYVEHLFAIIRPRKLLYMAIDGVAPRAKMNQQRSRRFCSVFESEERREIELRVREEFKHRLAEQGIECELPPIKESWDHNVITPGTPFMARLSECLRYFVHMKMNTDPEWKNITVIISDSNVPGEGEHKIMKYIREQRAQPGYDPNMKHVIYGLDADLIFLGLATHEPHCYILREMMRFGKRVLAKVPRLQGPNEPATEVHDPFELLDLHILREYMRIEFNIDETRWVEKASVRKAKKAQQMKEQSSTMVNNDAANRSYDTNAEENKPKCDFERVIDDFVLMCFFVGNDFLPHMASMSIREGALDCLINIYKAKLPEMRDYLTDKGDINFESLEQICVEIGALEDRVFQLRYQANPPTTVQKQFMERSEIVKKSIQNLLTKTTAATNSNNQPGQEGGEAATAVQTEKPKNMSLRDKQSFEKQVMELLKTEFQKRVGAKDAAEVAKRPDKVKLMEAGWKERFYMEKFGVPVDKSPESVSLRRRLVQSYLEGLSWVMKYYYQGCCSWGWYYPFHYGPFASDLVNLTSYKVEFELGEPFQPLEQLMAVLPPKSSHCLPEKFRELMCNPDSPIADFYPSTIEYDLNGKAHMWQAVVLLPFIDETRLKNAVRPLLETLTKDEKARNALGTDIMFVHCKNKPLKPLVELIQQVSKAKKTDDKSLIPSMQIHELHRMFGYIRKYASRVPYKGNLEAPVRDLPPVKDNRVLSCKFYLPPHTPHVPQLLPGVKLRPPVLASIRGGIHLQYFTREYAPIKNPHSIVMTSTAFVKLTRDASRRGPRQQPNKGNGSQQEAGGAANGSANNTKKRGWDELEAEVETQDQSAQQRQQQGQQPAQQQPNKKKRRTKKHQDVATAAARTTPTPAPSDAASSSENGNATTATTTKSADNNKQQNDQKDKKNKKKKKKQNAQQQAGNTVGEAMNNNSSSSNHNNVQPANTKMEIGNSGKKRKDRPAEPEARLEEAKQSSQPPPKEQESEGKKEGKKRQRSKKRARKDAADQ